MRVPVGSGIPEQHYAHTLVAVWNDLDGAERVIRRHRHELAAVITEPVMADKSVVPPDPGYLQALKRLCRENDVLFVLDEVITGFRMAPGGMQEVYGLRPDLTTFAKAMANGADIGAFVGRREIMALLEGGASGTRGPTPRAHCAWPPRKPPWMRCGGTAAKSTASWTDWALGCGRVCASWPRFEHWFLSAAHTPGRRRPWKDRLDLACLYVIGYQRGHQG